MGDPRARREGPAGAAPYRAAPSEPVAMGSVGAGTGAVVAGWRGPDQRRKGGVGSHRVRVGDATMGALVVLNAVGDVFTLEGVALTGGGHVPGPPAGLPRPGEGTTPAPLATAAALDRSALGRLCVQAHDAMAACLRPSHTRYDGDVAFAVSCGAVTADADALGAAAFEAVGRSIEAAVRQAASRGGIPGIAAWPESTSS